MADTDGDGKGDYDELTDGQRDPIVAQSPALSLALTPGTSLDIFLNVTYADSSGTASSYGQSVSSDSATTHAGDQHLGQLEPVGDGHGDAGGGRQGGLLRRPSPRWPPAGASAPRRSPR